MIKKDKNVFFEECKIKHSSKYIYHDDFVDMKTKIKITCPIHGDFFQEPRHHVNGVGCPKCSHKSYKYTNDEFLEMAKSVHGEKYTYSSEYIARNKKIKIICPIHGEFEQKPYSHLSGSGCPKCADLVRSKKRMLGWDGFVKRAKSVHGDKYIYQDEFDYKNNYCKVPIICLKHGEFWQSVNKHLSGCGCPLCSESKLEELVSNVLKKNNIAYVYEYKLPYNQKSSLDFYLSEHNIAIECQGEQHFKPIEYFGGKEEFKRRNELDKMKHDYCKENNIKLLYFSVNEFKTFLNEKTLHTGDELIGEIFKKE